MGRPRRRQPDNRAVESAAEAAEVMTTLASTSLQPYPKNRPAPDLESYVAEAREAARRVAESMAMRRTGNPALSGPDEIDVQSRIEKAVAYARWRWHGYRDGEIASL